MSSTYVIVLVVYLFILFTLGVLGYLKSKATEEDFYLAGRGQGIIVTVFTIMATMFSSAAVLGIPGAVYREGVAFVIFALNLPVAGASIYIFGSRFMRIGRKRGYVTPGDMIAGHYGDAGVLRILVAITGALYVLPYVIMQIKAGGVLAQTMFPDAGSAFAWGTGILSVVTVFYVLVGGMRSVAWTDVLQGALLLFGMVLAGVATIVVMNRNGGFWAQIQQMPPEALRLPGATGDWPWSKLLTVVMYASVASIIQPSQWMRLFAAKDASTLKRSALIFATVLPSCFLFGVMLVALGGRAMYPPDRSVTGEDILAVQPPNLYKLDFGEDPHPDVGAWDQIVPVMIQSQLPELLGNIGVILVAVIFVAVLAASMSTADSNLHGFSAVFNRDIYERFFRPKSSERERAWVSRISIITVMGAALALVHFGDAPGSSLGSMMAMIATLMFVAISFSCQLLPMVIDMLFIRRGTAAGAMAGLAAGIATVLLFTPLNSLAPPVRDATNTLKALLDVGFCGFAVNSVVFAVVSCFTPSLPRKHLDSIAEDLG